jgi:hypothetical protein
VPTARSNHDPDYFVPAAFNYARWDEKRLTGIYDWCDAKAKNGKPLRVLVVLDDCNSVTEMRGVRVLKQHKVDVYSTAPVSKILTEGRHAHMGLLCGLQNAFDAPVAARNQATCVVAFPNPNKDEVEKLWKDYASSMPKALFKYVFAYATAAQPDAPHDAPKRALVIMPHEVSSASSPIAGLYSWDPPYIDRQFRCGRAEFYKLSADFWSAPPPPPLDPWAAGGKGNAASNAAARVLTQDDVNTMEVVVPQQELEFVEDDDAPLYGTRGFSLA